MRGRRGGVARQNDSLRYADMRSGAIRAARAGLSLGAGRLAGQESKRGGEGPWSRAQGGGRPATPCAQRRSRPRTSTAAPCAPAAWRLRASMWDKISNLSLSPRPTGQIFEGGPESCREEKRGKRQQMGRGKGQVVKEAGTPNGTAREGGGHTGADTAEHHASQLLG